jgi:hypothetical protein
MKKRRVNYNVTERQFERLASAAEKRQLSSSELLRRILDDWFQKEFEKEAAKEKETR